MAARDKSRFTTAQAGWIALAIFSGWLVFLFLPVSRKPKPPAATELPPVTAQSKLEAVGLTNNPDWQGLPDYFAIWADSLEWHDDRTAFAYWNPGSLSYSYFFEATRANGRYRFRGLSHQESSASEALLAGMIGGQSDTHPFVFWRTEVPPGVSVDSKPGLKLWRPPPPPVKVDLPVTPIPVPPPLPLKDESH
jgi:hypothetical protein